MRLRFWRNKRQTTRLDEIEAEAVKVHQKNITNIRQSRGDVDKLNIALKQNNIVFQLASVMGHTK